MRKYNLLLVLSLIACLFIYVFYRTEKTIVNQLLISIFSYEKYSLFRSSVETNFPLNSYLVYSLPEGLWVFCLTITSIPFYIELGNWKIRFVFIPVIFAIGLEVLQLLHITNGRFDVMDILFSLLFWCLASILRKDDVSRENILRSLNAKSASCVFNYCIVYLAHVTS
jgi:hypothetical protein